MSDFKRAYINLVVEHLNDERLHERRLHHGIMGEAGLEQANSDATRPAVAFRARRSFGCLAR